jgi:hypothetical protein
METVYENKWCKIVGNGMYYILKSKSGKYADQYFLTLTEALTKVGVL